MHLDKTNLYKHIACPIFFLSLSFCQWQTRESASSLNNAYFKRVTNGLLVTPRFSFYWATSCGYQRTTSSDSARLTDCNGVTRAD